MLKDSTEGKNLAHAALMNEPDGTDRRDKGDDYPDGDHDQETGAHQPEGEHGVPIASSEHDCRYEEDAHDMKTRTG